MSGFLNIAILILIVSSLSAETILIDETFTSLNTSSHAELYKDYSQSLEIYDLLSNSRDYSFTKNTSNSIRNKRSPGSNLWIKLSIENTSLNRLELRLVARSDALLYTLFETEGSTLLNEFRSGMNVSSIDKPLQNYSVAFPIHIPPHKIRTLYIKVNSDHIANEIFCFSRVILH